MWTGFPLCAVHQARESAKSQDWPWKGIRFLIPLLPHTDSWSLSPQSLLEGSSLGSCCVDTAYGKGWGHFSHSRPCFPDYPKPTRAPHLHSSSLSNLETFASALSLGLSWRRQGRGWLQSTNNGHGRYLTTGRFYQMILARKFFPVELKSALCGFNHANRSLPHLYDTSSNIPKTLKLKKCHHHHHHHWVHVWRLEDTSVSQFSPSTFTWALRTKLNLPTSSDKICNLLGPCCPYSHYCCCCCCLLFFTYSIYIPIF